MTEDTRSFVQRLLENIEWVELDGDGVLYCPDCFCRRPDINVRNASLGHAEDCDLQKALELLEE